MPLASSLRALLGFFALRSSPDRRSIPFPSARLLATLAIAVATAGSLGGCQTFSNAKDEAEGEAQGAVDGAEIDANNSIDGAKEQAAQAGDQAIDELDKAAPAASKDLGLSKRSLFERAGGRAKMDAVASDFVDLLGAHPTFKTNPAVAEALARDPSRHKQMLSEYLCRVAGGPCQYTGRGMKDAHSGMQVTEAQWKTMGSLFIKAMRKNNVPKPERVELATLVAANKPLVVSQ